MSLKSFVSSAFKKSSPPPDPQSRPSCSHTQCRYILDSNRRCRRQASVTGTGLCLHHENDLLSARQSNSQSLATQVLADSPDLTTALSINRALSHLLALGLERLYSPREFDSFIRALRLLYKTQPDCELELTRAGFARRHPEQLRASEVGEGSAVPLQVATDLSAGAPRRARAVGERHVGSEPSQQETRSAERPHPPSLASIAASEPERQRTSPSTSNPLFEHASKSSSAQVAAGPCPAGFSTAEITECPNPPAKPPNLLRGNSTTLPQPVPALKSEPAVVEAELAPPASGTAKTTAPNSRAASPCSTHNARPSTPKTAAPPPNRQSSRQPASTPDPATHTYAEALAASLAGNPHGLTPDDLNPPNPYRNTTPPHAKKTHPVFRRHLCPDPYEGLRDASGSPRRRK